MRGRGKAVESSTHALLSDAGDPRPPCRKHPSSSSSVGICAYCLRDRLIKLVCSDCGEQRLSSCSCSDISSNRNSCSVEVGSVGRISFLIESEKASAAVDPRSQTKPPSIPQKCSEKVAAEALEMNSSCPVYEKRRSFWHVGWIFRKRKETGVKAGVLSSDRPGLSGSKMEGGSSHGDFIDLNVDLLSHRKGGLSGLGAASTFQVAEVDSSLGSGKKGGGRNSSILGRFGSLKELTAGTTKTGAFSSLIQGNGLGGMRSCSLGHEEGGTSSGCRSSGSLSKGGSCRITVNDCDSRGGKKSAKAWRWIFRNSRGRSGRK